MSSALVMAKAYLQAAWANAGKVVYRAGVIMPDTGEWRVHEANTRAALGEFWRVKAAEYANATEAERPEWLAADAEAHRVWAQLEQQLQYTDAPENVKSHGEQAQLALSRAIALSSQAGDARMAERSRRMAMEAPSITANATRNAIDVSYSGAVKSQVSGMLDSDWLGIPVWAWAIGGGLVILAVVRR